GEQWGARPEFHPALRIDNPQLNDSALYGGCQRRQSGPDDRALPRARCAGDEDVPAEQVEGPRNALLGRADVEPLWVHGDGVFREGSWNRPGEHVGVVDVDGDPAGLCRPNPHTEGAESVGEGVG